MLHTHSIFNRVYSASTVLFFALLVMIIFPVSFAMDNTNATITPSETTLNLSTSDLSLDLAVDNPAGTFAASTPAEISVVTNNYSGYTLGISASDDVNNTKLINTNDNTAYLNSISSASSAEEFNTNNWGYLPNKLNGAANSAYQPAPTTTATILDATNVANAEANTYTIALGAKADYSLPSGTYENSFTLTAVANPVNYTITYNKNTEDEVTNMPANLVGDTTATTVTISNLVPQRTNYTFLGWNTAADGSGTTYNPNGGGTDLIYNIDQTSVNTGVLYAQWKPDKIYIQNVTTETCPTTATVVYDNRDETEYHIQKLPDGRCWMLDNLELDLTNSTILNSLDSINTNASTTSLTSLRSGNRAAGDQYATSGVIDWPSSSYSYSVPWVNMTNRDIIPDNAPVDSAGYNKVGGYYNFCAASAGSYCYGNGTSQGTASGNATEDICPKNWRMPIGNTSGEYDTLRKSANTTDISDYRSILSLPLSGYFQYGLASSQSNYGYFWSNTQYYSSAMYSLSVNTNYFSPYNSGYLYYGYPIRCVAKNPEVIITFNANGGSGSMSNQTLESNAASLNPNVFTRSGYTFASWNTEADGSGTSYTDKTVYTGDSSTILYAQWVLDVTIAFNANGGNGSIPNQTIKYPGDNLNSNTFSRSNYFFTGWNTNADGSGVSYNDGVKMNNFGTASIVLYAQWVSKASLTPIQNITASTCPTTAVLTYDSRDDTLYHIQKLADGKCWMLDNLALDPVNNTVKNNMTASNTNASTTTLDYLKNGGGTSGSYYATDGVSYCDPNGSNNQIHNEDNPLIDLTVKNVVPDNAPENGAGFNKVGGYYNYCAASAGSFCKGYSDVHDTTEDICPNNWRMPIIEEYMTLGEKIYGSTRSTWDATEVANFRNALSLPLSGYSSNGSPGGQGALGSFWSGSRVSPNYQANLTIRPGQIQQNDNSRRYVYASIRCVAK